MNNIQFYFKVSGDTMIMVGKILLDFLPVLITLLGIGFTHTDSSLFTNIWIEGGGLLWLGVLYYVGVFKNLFFIIESVHNDNKKIRRILLGAIIFFICVMILLYSIGIFNDFGNVVSKYIISFAIYIGAGVLYVLSSLYVKQIY